MSNDNTLTTTKPAESLESQRIAQEASDATTKLNKQNPLVAKDATSTQSTGDQARNISYEMSQGAGIGNSGKVESFTTVDGKNISGQTFTTKDGTYMKVAGSEGDGTNGKGSTYKIETGTNGERSLSSIDASGKKEPVELKQSSDKLSAGNNDKPAANTDRSATGNDNTAASNDKPAPSPEKPVASNERPSVSENAAASNERSVTANSNPENAEQTRSHTNGDRDAASAAANKANGSGEYSHDTHSDSSRTSNESHVQNTPQPTDITTNKAPALASADHQNFIPPQDTAPPSTANASLNAGLRNSLVEGRESSLPSSTPEVATPQRSNSGELHQATGQPNDLHQGNPNNDSQVGRQRYGTADDGRQPVAQPPAEAVIAAKPTPVVDGTRPAPVGDSNKAITPTPNHIDTPVVANNSGQILPGNSTFTGTKSDISGPGALGQTKETFQPATPASPALQGGFSGDPAKRFSGSGDQTQGSHDNNNNNNPFHEANQGNHDNRDLRGENNRDPQNGAIRDSGNQHASNGGSFDGSPASQGQPHPPEGQNFAPPGSQRGDQQSLSGIVPGGTKSGADGLISGPPKGGVEGTSGLGTPSGLRSGSDGLGGTNLPKSGAPELPNLPGGINHTGSDGAPIISGLRPGGDGNPILNTPRPGADGSAIPGILKPGADGNPILNAPRPGADVNALPGMLKPGPEVLSKVAPVSDVLSPTSAQNLALRQAGFNISNPADAAFLTNARAQLMSGRIGDGTTANTTLAHALSNASPVELNKLAVLLTGRPDMAAQNVMLNEANLARLNALFRPEAIGGLSGLPSTMDVKGLAGKGMGDFLAGHQGPLAQKDVYMELSKLLSINSLTTTQRLTMVDVLNHSVNPLATTLVPGKLDSINLAAKPENAAALATALLEARTRAAELTELVGAKAIVPVGARADLAEGTGALAIGKGLIPGNQLNDIKTGLAEPRLATRPNTLSTSEALATTRATQDAVRANAGRIADIEAAEGGTDIHLTPRNDTVEISDKHADAKKKPDKKGDNQGLSIDASILTGAALRMFDGKGEEKKENVNTTKKDDENKSQRRKYTVQLNDTLESIAQKTFRDTRLAALIAAVNSEVLATDMNPRAPLTVGLSIWIPSEIEVEDFTTSISVQAAEEKLSPEEELARRFGNGWDGAAGKSDGPDTEPVAKNTLMDAAVSATAKRRENVEKLLGPLTAKTPEFITYTVRLGDSLKSIATKHPALQDVSLWVLIAKVNNISVPANNPSAVKLGRGSSLRLPAAAEIIEYRASTTTKKPNLTGVTGATAVTGGRTGPATGPKSLTIPAGNPFANNDLPEAIHPDTRGSVDENAVTRASAPVRDAGASLLRAGGFVKDQSRAQQDAATIVTTPVERLPRPEISKPVTTDRPSVENIKILAPNCRVVRRHQVDTSGRLYQAQLEVLHDGKWNSVMMYNISDGNCWRKSLNEVGVTEILQLELPTPAIHQMLESDFTNNWEEYRERFINTVEF